MTLLWLTQPCETDSSGKSRNFPELIDQFSGHSGMIFRSSRGHRAFEVSSACLPLPSGRLQSLSREDAEREMPESVYNKASRC